MRSALPLPRSLLGAQLCPAPRCKLPSARVRDVVPGVAERDAARGRLVLRVRDGDHARVQRRSFSTLAAGRVFAAAWIAISTLLVALFFLYAAELYADRRQQALARWLLTRRTTSTPHPQRPPRGPLPLPRAFSYASMRGQEGAGRSYFFWLRLPQMAPVTGFSGDPPWSRWRTLPFGRAPAGAADGAGAGALPAKGGLIQGGRVEAWWAMSRGFDFQLHTVPLFFTAACTGLRMGHAVTVFFLNKASCYCNFEVL
ncbi:unnamed protein product [Urochloa humidicola]